MDLTSKLFSDRDVGLLFGDSRGQHGFLSMIRIMQSITYKLHPAFRGWRL